MKRFTVLLGALVLCAGCTTAGVRRGLYEGVRVRNDLQSTPQERAGQPGTPDFTTYERMRSEVRP